MRVKRIFLFLPILYICNYLKYLTNQKWPVQPQLTGVQPQLTVVQKKSIFSEQYLKKDTYFLTTVQKRHIYSELASIKEKLQFKKTGKNQNGSSLWQSDQRRK